MTLSRRSLLLLALWLAAHETVVSAFAVPTSTTNDFSSSASASQQRHFRSASTTATTTSTTALHVLSRRSMLSIGGGFLTASPLAFHMNAAIEAAEAASSAEPVADLPMIRLRLPQGGFGREYVAIKLKIQGEGPFDFMLDTGLTTEFITPHLQHVLHISASGADKISGLAAGGGTVPQDLVPLQGASLCCGKLAGGVDELPLPPLSAVVTDFPQEHSDPAHDPVEGMLGMELLSQYDVDFDFPNNRLRLWKPGTAAAAAKAANLVAIPAVVINETGLIGIRVSSPDVPGGQPILGFLDCGSSFSALNWAAAQYLGIPPKNDPVAYAKNPFVMALGIDGRPLKLPTTSTSLSFKGDMERDPDTGRPTGFASPPKNWKAWDAIQVAVGDLPVFTSALGDGRTPYRGPAALIGLDVLAQRRVILETGGIRTRQRRVFVSPH